jgi:hypothetical protein
VLDRIVDCLVACDRRKPAGNLIVIKRDQWDRD